MGLKRMKKGYRKRGGSRHQEQMMALCDMQEIQEITACGGKDNKSYWRVVDIQ
jgi:hypothetical protein